MEIASAGADFGPVGASIASAPDSPARLLALLTVGRPRGSADRPRHAPAVARRSLSAPGSRRSGWPICGPCVPTYEAHPPLYYSLLKLWRSCSAATARRAARAVRSCSDGDRSRRRSRRRGEQERQRPSRAPVASRRPRNVPLPPARRCSCARPGSAALSAAGLSPMRSRSSGSFGFMRRVARRERGRLVSWAILAAGTELTLWSHALGLLYAVCLAAALAPAWLSAPLDRKRIARGIGGRRDRAAALSPVPDDDAQPRRRLGHRLARLGSQHAAAAARALHGAGRGPDRRLRRRRARHAAAGQARHPGRHSGARAGIPTARSCCCGSARRSSRWLISALCMPVFLARTLSATLVPGYLAMAGALARSGAEGAA